MHEKKKILYVITKGNFGGAQRYVFDLAASLPKERFEVAVMCGEGEFLKKRLEEVKIKVIDLAHSQREIDANKDWKTFKELIKTIKEEKPDVVHLNSSKIGLIGSLACLYLKARSYLSADRAGKIKTIFTAHGWAFNEKTRSVFSRFIYYLGHYLTVLICDQTIAVSEKAKKDMASFPFIKNRLKVIYNGISRSGISAMKMSKVEARRILASRDADKTIVFSIAELHKNKGVDIAIKALSLLPKEVKSKIIYSIAGSGEEKKNLERLAIDLDIKKIVRFLGFVPEAKELLSGADIFLLPSRTEAFPYAILEAGAAGSSVIATGVGGVPEVMRDMQNGILIHPQNPKEIAEAILYLLDHPEKKKEFGEEIKKTITNFFGLDKMLSETIKIYSM